ncbi:hypothetical protein SGRA_3774 [Saprospira grandis str. Lewin]|uniref:Uncharacterized protein n=1 Tax=Saprospira grandis (strain Lewin) TaxID=984262 RepID=H6L8C6_SAPGL|nr:hypothetical protein SGRA_3774 [Saprospira grandis str. Lewin]
MFKAVEDFNPLRTIDVEWGCCMAAGFNLQPAKPQKITSLKEFKSRKKA